MVYTKGEWKADVRVGVVAVYPDNEITRGYLPCIPDRKVCIFYKEGRAEYKPDGNFKQWNVDEGDIADANLIAAAPDMYEALELVDRAWVGDGVDMARAVDAVLLAKSKAERRT